jgi:anaerobic glycerol-3-phosphate dehydrogenase
MKTTKSIQLTSAEIVTLLASLKASKMMIQGIEEYKEFNDKLRDLETTVRQQS